jgi:hypothetical protein
MLQSVIDAVEGLLRPATAEVGVMTFIPLQSRYSVPGIDNNVISKRFQWGIVMREARYLPEFLLTKSTCMARIIKKYRIQFDNCWARNTRDENTHREQPRIDSA